MSGQTHGLGGSVSVRSGEWGAAFAFLARRSGPVNFGRLMGEAKGFKWKDREREYRTPQPERGGRTASSLIPPNCPARPMILLLFTFTPLAEIEEWSSMNFVSFDNPRSA